MYSHAVETTIKTVAAIKREYPSFKELRLTEIITTWIRKR